MVKAAKLISIILHPINIFPCISLLYFSLQPTYIYKPQQYLILAIIGIIGYIFPLLTLLILKQFKMIESYDIPTVKERKFPLLLFICTSAIIGNYLFKTKLVPILAISCFAYIIALLICYFLLNLKIRISLHVITISSACVFIAFFSYYYKINLLILIGIFCILTGLVITSRLILKAHTSTEVYSGLIIGIASQLIMFLFFTRI